jgi:signal transduction histidine kinase
MFIHGTRGEIMKAYPLYRVLVVEDDAAVRDSLLQHLGSNQYCATGVSSIAETLALPNLADFQAILLDWELPDGTADDLLPSIQSLAPDAASVVVTGDANINASIAALRHGAVDYLVKPINPHCLQASMARIELLRESKRRFALCERLATIGQAVTSVAHESRNALQRIQAKVELLELDLANDQEKLADLRVIKAASQNLRSMFEELREFAAPIVLRRESCHLRELIQRAWQSLETLPEAQAACLEYDCDDIELSVDSMRLEQVFRNLFENALAACPSPARIDVSWSTVSQANRTMLRIVVRDNGPGFSEEQKEKAFEPFFTTKSKGTGLGLPICNRILEQHQGWLEIGPDSEAGGCMILTLPLDLEAEQLSAASHRVCEVA